MRFQVSQVMDAIEQRLTTDVAGAQAVADLGKIIRFVELDGGRPVNLVRIGMAVDALSRYLIDSGALLYGVVERALLSESALTSKERMVLSRWVDDGVVESAAVVENRAAEVAQLVGLPLITVGGLATGGSRPGEVLQLSPWCGAAVLAPLTGDAPPPAGTSAPPAIGRAKVPVSPEAGSSAAGTSGDAPAEDAPAGEAPAEDAPAGDAPAEDAPAGDAPAGDAPAGDAPAGDDPAAAPVDDPAAGILPVPVAVFGGRGVSRVRVSRHRWLATGPDPAHAGLLARQWRCTGFECPAFGEFRRIGQPVPQLRDAVPVCPRHAQPVTDAGARPRAFPVAIVIDDLPRRRLVVREGQPVPVGSAAAPAAGGDEDEEVASVAPWLHKAAATWISPVHLRLAAGPDGLVVTDLSERGTVVWQRSGPDDPGTTRTLRRESYQLGEWDSVELYTGIELVRGDRRRATVVGPDEPASVLVDAPTAAHHQVSSAGR